MVNRNLSPNTINHFTIHLKAFVNFCSEGGYCDLTIPVYQRQETIKDTYTDYELARLLKKPDMNTCNFPTYRNWVIVSLLVNNGMRAGTLRNLLIKDINFDKGTIIYRHTKRGGLYNVPIGEYMKPILREYLEIREGEPSDYVFPSERGGMITDYGLTNAIARYNKSRGVAKTSIHLFRHSFAERFLQAGGSPFELQKILGHSTLEMTKHYCRIYSTDIVNRYSQLSPLGKFM